MKLNQRERIEQLKAEIREITVEVPIFGTMKNCPPDIQEQFLKQVLALEQAPLRPLFDVVVEEGLELPEPEQLSDTQVSVKLWELDLVGYGTDEDTRVYLKYYADDQERELYAKDFPDLEIPERCVPPYRRDHLLPGN